MNNQHPFLIASLFGLAILSTPTLIAAPLTTPNTFSAGQTASASQVNENFSAIESSVNDNDQRLDLLESDAETVQTQLEANATNIANNSALLASQPQRPIISVFFGDARVGTLIDLPPIDGYTTGAFMTPNGFFAEIGLEPGSYGPVKIKAVDLYFLEAGCTGQPYILGAQSEYAYLGVDALYRNGDDNYYVVLTDSAPSTVAIRNRLAEDGTCYYQASTSTVYPAYQNTVDLSGVSNSQLSGDFRIGFE